MNTLIKKIILFFKKKQKYILYISTIKLHNHVGEIEIFDTKRRLIRKYFIYGVSTRTLARFINRLQKVLGNVYIRKNDDCGPCKYLVVNYYLHWRKRDILWPKYQIESF